MDKLNDEYKLGYHKAAKMAHIGTYAQMWCVSDLDEDILRGAKFNPQKSVQEALDKAIELITAQRKEPYAIILPQGSLTVPLIDE